MLYLEQPIKKGFISRVELFPHQGEMKFIWSPSTKLGRHIPLFHWGEFGFEVMALLLTRRKKSHPNKSFKRQNKSQVVIIIKVHAKMKMP